MTMGADTDDTAAISIGGADVQQVGDTATQRQVPREGKHEGGVTGGLSERCELAP